jgi:hypothetical protein
MFLPSGESAEEEFPMGGDVFWTNLQTAAKFLAPAGAADLPGLDADSLAKRLAAASNYLPPEWVDDFEPQDFAFLDPADLERLRKNVESIRPVANRAPTDEPASPRQFHDAAAAFEELIRLLRSDQFLDFDSFMIHYRLERVLQGKLPPWIESFTCQTGIDVAGDPAVWVTLNVSLEAVEKELAIKEGRPVRDMVDRAVRRLRTGHWPYITFQSLDELAAMRKGRRK